MEKKKVYVVFDCGDGINRAVFDDKEKCIAFLLKYYIEDNEDYIEDIVIDFSDAPQKNEDDEIDFETFYEWVKETLTDDIQALNGYDFSVEALYLNEG
jgi:hypothetical protein